MRDEASLSPEDGNLLRSTRDHSPRLRHTTVLSGEEIAALEVLRRNEGVEAIVALSASLGVLLSRYLDQDRITCCMQARGHQSHRLDLEFSENSTFRELTRTVQDQVCTTGLVQMLGKSVLALPQRVACIIPDELMHPLMQPAYETVPVDGIGSALSVCFEIEPEQLCVSWDYNVDAFEEWIISQLAEHFRNLLRHAIAEPTALVLGLEVLGDEERHRICIEWNNTYKGYSEKCIHELFENQVLATPDAVALLYQDHKLTYAELNSRANQWAHYLRKRGVGPEVPVGVVLERSMEAAVVVLGILKAGGAFLMLSSRHPRSLLNEIIEQSELPLIIAPAALKDRMEFRSPVEIIPLERLSGAAGQEAKTNVESGVTPDNAAYITFTSGSSGKPKGVIGMHRSITNGLTHAYFKPDRNNEVCCLHQPLSFAGAVATFLLPVSVGVPLVIVPEGHEKDPQKLSRLIEEQKVTSMVMVPSLLRQLLGLGLLASSRFESIRTIALSGSTVTPDLLGDFEKTMPKAELLISYSSSEVGCCATSRILDTHSASDPVSVGPAAPNTHVYILDRLMNPVPVGVAGELYVAAQHLARGYVGQPKLTAERFLPNPFAVMSGARLYRTGDRARFRRNGDVELLGRGDNQVKIRGFRVEAGQVEAAIATHPEVKEAAVVGCEIDKEQRLVSYIATKTGAVLSVTELRRYLQQRLPEYMIPSSFVFLERLPLSSHGKLDRSALPLPAARRPLLDSQYEKPRNPLETSIAQTWEDILGLSPVGIHDEFLDIGGDSMRAAQVALRIRELFGVEIPLPMFFEWMTVADLATEVSRSLAPINEK